MLFTISIFWKNDSNELFELPDVNVMTCGNDGMEVIGTRADIDELAEYVAERPDKYTTDGIEQADESDIQTAIEFWTEADKVPVSEKSQYDRIALYEHLGHKTSEYYYILAETLHDHRYWTVAGDRDVVAKMHRKHVFPVYAHDKDHAIAVAEANGDPEAWVNEGEVIWLA